MNDPQFRLFTFLIILLLRDRIICVEESKNSTWPEQSGAYLTNDQPLLALHLAFLEKDDWTFHKQYARQPSKSTSTASNNGSSTVVTVYRGTTISGINTTLVDVLTQANTTITDSNFTATTTATSTPYPYAENYVLKKVVFPQFSIPVNLTSYNLGALIPLTQSKSPSLAGVQYVEAFKCQVNLINGDPAVLPDSFITYTVQNSDILIPSGTGDAYLLERDDVFMVVGPPVDEQTTSIGYLYAAQNITFVSYDTSSVDLVNTTIYPSFFRTIPSDALQARSMVETFGLFGWYYVAAIFSADDYGTSGRQSLLSEAENSGIVIACQQSSNPNSTNALEDFSNCVAGSQATVVLLWSNPCDEPFKLFLILHT